MRNVRATWPGRTLLASDAPSTLFEGETLHLFAAWDAFPAGDLSLSWTVDGARVPEALRVPMPCQVQQDDTLVRLFGARRVAAAERAGDHAAATELAVKYQLVSDQTNYLVVLQRADAEKAINLPELKTVPQMMAAGWGGTSSVQDTSVKVRKFCAPPEVCVKMYVAVAAPAMDMDMDIPEALFARSPQCEQAWPDHEDGTLITPAELLGRLWEYAKMHGGLPPSLRDILPLLPIAVASKLLDLATSCGAEETLRIFYAALLSLSRQGVGERQLQRHLARNAGATRPGTPWAVATSASGWALP